MLKILVFTKLANRIYFAKEFTSYESITIYDNNITVFHLLQMGCVASKTKLENLELELGVEKNDNKMAPNQQQKIERKISTEEATNTKLEKQTQTCEIFNPELQDCDEVSQSLGDFMMT